MSDAEVEQFKANYFETFRPQPAPPEGERPWQRYILDVEGLRDWVIEEGEAYCWLESKTIKIPHNCPDALFLHEVAHALHPQLEGEQRNHYHGGKWALTFQNLISKYMYRLGRAARQQQKS